MGEQEEERQKREAREAAEEEAFRQRMMEQLAESDRIEQMKATERRIQVQRHREAVARLWAEKQEREVAEKAAEEAELARQKAEEERRKAIIEAERRRLLREAADLVDYLPKGVIQKIEDLQLMESNRSR